MSTPFSCSANVWNCGVVGPCGRWSAPWPVIQRKRNVKSPTTQKKERRGKAHVRKERINVVKSPSEYARNKLASRHLQSSKLKIGALLAPDAQRRRVVSWESEKTTTRCQKLFFVGKKSGPKRSMPVALHVLGAGSSLPPPCLSSLV